MTVTRLLVLMLSLSCAFLLGREFARRGGDSELPGPGYAVQVARSVGAAAALDESPARTAPSFVEVADRLRPSVVSIRGATTAGAESSGTGIIVSEDGAVLTNYHVVAGLTEIFVTLSSTDYYEARLIGKDEPTDLAILKIRGVRGLQPAAFGDSDAIKVGEDVLAIGNALGFGWTATRGIVSSLHRSELALPEDYRSDRRGPARYTDFVQIDAAINPGNSGGPVVNARGEVIGINTAIIARRYSEGIGFAIPSNDARFVADALMREGRVRRGYLGVKSESLSILSNADRRRVAPGAIGGIIVKQVVPNTPAHRYGLQIDDVILAVDGRSIESSSGFRNVVARIPPQTEVSLRLVRDGRERDVRAVVAEFPAGDG
jgi:S1-C subfamily serine protease